MASKIDTYGIGQEIIRLREEMKLSLIKTVEIINAKHLPEGTEPINAMTVMRWEKRKEIEEATKSITGVSALVNTYDDMVQLRGRAERQLRWLSSQLKSAVLTEDKIAYSNAYEKQMKRKQDITNDITKYQKELMKTENIKKVLEVIVTELQKEPDIYARIMARITEDRELFDLLRSL